MLYGKRKLGVLMILTAMLLAGCMSGGVKDTSNAESGTLKVMHYDERSFYQSYGMLFAALYPNIEIEVVSTMNIAVGENVDYQQAYQDYIDEHKPDVLMIDINRFEEYARDGKLLALEPLLSRDKVDTSGLLPGLLDNLRERGGGQLYGMTPEFSSTAVYYNKDLFDRHNVSYPQDKMSWEDLLQLAARFPQEGADGERLYGLKIGYQANLFQFGNMIGTTQGLSFLDPTAMQVTINSDAWKRVYSTALQALKSGSLFDEDMMMMSGPISYEEHLLRDPFVSGKVAMTIDGTYLVNQIKEVQANANVKDRAIANWDIVTMPVDPERPDYSSSVSYYNMFAIDANSPNLEAAWEFVKYIHSEEYARVKSKSGSSGNLPVHTKYIQDNEGRSLEAFYALKPAPYNMYQDYQKMPESFAMSFMGMANQMMESAMDETRSISDILDDLQEQAQQILTESSKE